MVADFGEFDIRSLQGHIRSNYLTKYQEKEQVKIACGHL